MADVLETQLRLIYTLLKPAIRAAAHFGVPIRSLIELVRLAYFEHLRRTGLGVAEIARTFDQTPRHMRSLAQRLETDFFDAEREVGLVREVEALVASSEPTDDEIVDQLAESWATDDVRAAIRQLLDEERIERRDDGHLLMASRYVIFRSDHFHHRIDAINHFLDAGFGAVLHRLVFDDAETALMKTISFSARAPELRDFVARLEGDLRRDLARLDEAATFAGQADQRYTLGLALAPLTSRDSDDFGDDG